MSAGRSEPILRNRQAAYTKKAGNTIGEAHPASTVDQHQPACPVKQVHPSVGGDFHLRGRVEIQKLKN